MKNAKIKSYIPLITIVFLISAFVFARQLFYGFSLQQLMHEFMGTTFFVFGFIKALRWKGFVEAFRSYDIIAKHSSLFAYLYPVIEMLIGILFFKKIYPVGVSVFTIGLLSFGMIGVLQELRKNNPFPCACLGAVFVLPMTWVTLFEDLFMIVMALALIFMY